MMKTTKTFCVERLRLVPAAALCLTLALGTTACSDDNAPGDTSRNWTENGGLRAADNLLFEGNQIGSGDKEFVFTGTQKLPKGVYSLKGWVYIAEGATLTLEPGTIIKGDKASKSAIIVERGGKLYASGTKDAPIVFTSGQPKGQRKPGDWGGLILCGKAPNNQREQQIEGGPRTKHGGNDAADCSGSLQYVRVEFAGYPFDTDKEINGITFGSVGSGTKVDHLQVSYSNDDSYEWFGGTVNCKYLVAYHGWDDDFDTDNGFSGGVQYALGVRDAAIADKSNSNGFESDNCAGGDLVPPYTTATFSNVTLVGPRTVSNNFVNGLRGDDKNPGTIDGGEYFPNNGSGLGLFQAAFQIRRSSHLSIINSVAMGYPIGLLIDGEKGDTQTFAKEGKLKLQNIWFADMAVTGSDANGRFTDDLYSASEKKVIDATKPSYSNTFFNLATNGNLTTSLADLLLSGRALFSGLDADIIPAAGSPLLSAATRFEGLPAFFDRVNFTGAFGTENWLEGWTNFNPNETDY